MKRIFAAVTMAAAALATLSLAGPSVVSAGTSSQAAAAHIGTTYSKGLAGYYMTKGGWHFRYFATTLTVPATETRATHADVSLTGGDAVGGVAAHLWIDSGGGPGSIGYVFNYSGPDQSTPLAVAPDVGDKVTVSIYYDHTAHKTTITAVDHTQGTRATDAVGAVVEFDRAYVTGGGPTWSLASSPTRLWAFKDSRLTSVSGRHGSIFGPWNTYRIVGARDYNPRKVVLWPTYPWNNGHNFSVWWRAAS